MKPGKQKRYGSSLRDPHVRVRTAKRRKISSTRWLDRQLNDPYVKLAKREGYKSRSAYKLKELDDRFKFLLPGKVVVDLGSTPGGWSQVASERVNAIGEISGAKVGSVFAFDTTCMDEVRGVTFVQLDVCSDSAISTICKAVGGQADVVVSDMASPSTGHRKTDHLRIIALCEAAFELAGQVLTADGVFVAKVFSGGAESNLQMEFKKRFASVRTFKPPASRKGSAEKYVVAIGFR